MKYQSELINEILEQRGHEKSSLHYESECIEQWIDENEGAYPKLCDYQSEWLNFIEENPIGKFPYETITNVTEATVDNVVPFAYKSAILSGNTLVNLAVNGLNKTYIQENSLTKLSNKMQPNKLYLLIIDVKENTLNKPFRFSGYTLGKNATILTESEISGDKDVLNVGETGRKCFKVGYTEIPEGAGESLIMYCDNATDGTLTGSATYNIMFLEYQEGLENWDIPYFEGMQSVKMPVLTTSNEDGTKTNILTVNEDITLRSNGDVYDELNLLTGHLTQRIDENNEVLAQAVVKTVDLSVTNQDGETLAKLRPIEGTMHIVTDGTPLKPFATMEIPVEATTQNLMSFIEE